MSITPERMDKLRAVAQRRQQDLTVVLENVHDPHNISAVLRTCECVGIPHIYVLYTQDRLDLEHLQMGKQSSASARKWIDVHYFDDVNACISHLKENYNTILGAYMNPEAKPLYDLNLSESTVLVFGNEREGISDELLAHLDGQFFIPQMGLTQSLNISVACAVSVYEALRQRQSSGMYPSTDTKYADQLYHEYTRRHLEKYDGADVIDHTR